LKKEIKGIKIRSQQTILHHVWKALQNKFMKDLSFGNEEPKIDNIEHVHHFHNVNSMGHAQRYTTMVGGHFHEVTWSIDQKSGEPMAKCGPAMKKVIKNTPRGTKTSIEPMKFYNKANDQWFHDNHSHDMEYKGSDELSTSYIQDIQNKNAAFIQSQEPKKSSEVSITDSDRE
jgi:hypothetical protein